MRILTYIAGRLLFLIPVLLGVTLLTFVISHAIPGDPARMIAGQRASDEAVENIRRSHGLDKPLPVQFVNYVMGLAKGDLGTSIRSQRPVLDDMKDYFPATLELTLAAMFICVVVGLPLGVYAAVRRGKLADHLSRIFSVFGMSTPVFWLGLMLLLLFYRHLGWLPGSGRVDIATFPPEGPTGLYILDSLIHGDMDTLKDALLHIIMPSFCLSYVYLAVITRVARSSMIAVLGQDYITTARANGIHEFKVVMRHALKNSLIPTVTITGLSIGELLGGAVLTETIFDWPGMGKYVVDSVNALDFPSIMGFTLVVALVYVLVNLAVDVLYAFLNPQIRYD